VTEATAKTTPSKIATIAMSLAAVALLAPGCGVLAIHAGALAPMTGFTIVFASCILGGLAALVLGLAGLWTTRGGTDREGRKRAWIGIGGGAALLGVVALAGRPGAGLPPINDISTDLAEPPAFAADPSGRGRDMTYPADFVEQVRASYPDLVPIELDLPPEEAFARARAAAEVLGWQVEQSEPEAGRLRATERTAVFLFVDDIVVRVRPESAHATAEEADGAGGRNVRAATRSRIDVRSKSRDGRGDLGANAARIRAFRNALDTVERSQAGGGG